MNSINFVGRLTENPAPAINSCYLGVAVPHPHSENNAMDYLPCVAYDDTASTIMQNFQKNDTIAFTGYLRLKSVEVNTKTYYDLMCVITDCEKVNLNLETEEELTPNNNDNSNFLPTRQISEKDIPW
ncbi:MAG: single-stranded DNA-binding protein [Selenomonadaceae bacterium]|nr:single-stranded DNA-binding protein [Selenomonadaceae bacterium]